jgi:hypothetical protein
MLLLQPLTPLKSKAVAWEPRWRMEDIIRTYLREIYFMMWIVK